MIQFQGASLVTPGDCGMPHRSLGRQGRRKLQVQLSPLPRAFEIEGVGPNRRLRKINGLARLNYQIGDVWNDELGIVSVRSRVDAGGSQCEGNEGRHPRA